MRYRADRTPEQSRRNTKHLQGLTAFKVKPAIYKKYFTASISQKEFDSIVDEALALYFAQKGHESEQEAG